MVSNVVYLVLHFTTARGKFLSNDIASGSGQEKHIR